jgi:hypothetical protein
VKIKRSQNPHPSKPRVRHPNPHLALSYAPPAVCGSITHGSGVTVVSGGVGGALVGRYGGGASWTNTSKPVDSGKFTGFAALDYLGYLLRRPCN